MFSGSLSGDICTNLKPKPVLELNSEMTCAFENFQKEMTPENLMLSASLAGDASTVQTLITSGVPDNDRWIHVTGFMLSEEALVAGYNFIV